MTLPLLALLASPCSAADVHRYAVVVGVNDGVPGDAPLTFAELDAERVGDVLESLGGVRSEDVVTLRSVDADRLRSALADLGDRIARHGGDAESLLFFYYSGHADADALHLQGSRLGLGELTALLGALPVDVRIVVVDACQSGELTRLKGAGPAEPFTIHAEDRLDSEGMAIITSSSAGEDAQESDRLRGGMFTHHFLAGLMGAADASGDGRVTLTEAYRYGRTETIRATSQARFVQHPAYAFELRGQADLVLTCVEEPGRNAALSLGEPGSWLVFAGRDGGELLTEVTVDRATQLLIPPGDYLVRLRTGRGVWERIVTLDRGGTVSLRAAQMSPVSYGATVRKGLEERDAWGILVGAGLTGAPVPSLGVGPAVRLAAQVDLEPLTIAFGALASAHAGANDQLTMHTVAVGAEAAGIRKVDVGAVAFGLGLRGGVDLRGEWFDTPGSAPPRQGLSGRAAPVASIEFPLGGPRTVAAIEADAGIHLLRRYDAEADAAGLATAVVPTLLLEVGRHVR
ncbi:MAG: caspase family protein [Myxococcota bacterium]